MKEGSFQADVRVYAEAPVERPIGASTIRLVGVLRVHSHAPRYRAARDFAVVVRTGASRRKWFGLLRNDLHRATLTTIDSRIRRSIARPVDSVESVVCRRGYVILVLIQRHLFCSLF